jgi:PKD repeat protein
VNTTVPNPDNVTAFSAERTTDGALTVMVINKYLTGSTPVTLSLANFPAAGTAQVYQLTSANSITRLADATVTGSMLSATVPQQSVTLFVLPRSSGNQSPIARIVATPTSGNMPLPVSFSGTTSSDADGTINSYAWTFGNGATASGASTTYTYTTAGSFTATLTVTDDKGATNTASVVITVADPNVLNPPSGLTATTKRGQPVTLRWTDNSTNETGFEVWRAPSGSTAFALLATTAANAVTYSDSAPRGNYQYKVRARNATSTSAYSNTVTISVK